MKKNFMTRVLAVAMSAAMALSMATATNLTVAEAASAPKMCSSSFTLRVGGAAKTYHATKATRKAYKIVKVASANKDKVATAKVVKSGKAVKLTAGTTKGKTSVKITFKNKTTAKKTTIKFSGKVKAAKVAEQSIKEIKQTAADTIEVTFAADVKDVAAANFAVTRETVNASNQVVVVKSATVDAKDAKKVTVVTYGKMNDAATYTVAFTANEKTVEAKFTATDGTVAKIDVTPTTVTAGKETTLYYITYDAAGIQLDKQKINADVDAKIEIAEKATTGVGYISGEKVYLANVGDTMEVNATYHTYKYEGTEEVGAVKNTVTITAVESAAKVSAVPYTISKNAVWNWSSITPKTSIALNDEDYYLRMLVMNDDGSQITSDDEYTVESSDNSVFVVNGDVAVANPISPVGVGTAYALVKDNKDNVVYSLPISVVAARTLTKVELSTTKLTIATRAAFGEIDAPGTRATVYDQYGVAMLPTEYDLSLELKTVPSGEQHDKATILGDMIVDGTIGQINGTIDFCAPSGKNYKPGSYTYVVTATDKTTGAKRSASYTVEIKQYKDSTDTLALVLTNISGNEGNATENGGITTAAYTSVDTTRGIPTTNTLKLHLVKKNSGVIRHETATGCTVAAVTVKKNGAAIAKSGKGLKLQTCAAVDEACFGAGIMNESDLSAAGGGKSLVKIEAVKNISSNLVKQLEPGNYSVEALVYTVKSGKVTTATVSTAFTVYDYDPALTISVLKTKMASQTIDDEDSDIFTYTYDGVDLIDYKNNKVNTDFMKGMAVMANTYNVKDYDEKDAFTATKNTLVAKKMYVKIDLPNRGETGTYMGASGTTVVIPVTKSVSFTNYDTGNTATGWSL